MLESHAVAQIVAWTRIRSGPKNWQNAEFKDRRLVENSRQFGCGMTQQKERLGYGEGELLTLHFERTPFEPSIQTYSAMTAPF